MPLSKRILEPKSVQFLSVVLNKIQNADAPRIRHISKYNVDAVPRYGPPTLAGTPRTQERPLSKKSILIINVLNLLCQEHLLKVS